MTDVEAIVADGFIDGYIDQSWSGAWEDVPSRHSTGMGWTHQLGYILAHRAQIEGGNIARAALPACSGCLRRAKHYVLHDTFDAFEGWDTLDNVPLKLIWGIWAYNHAAFEHANRTLSPPDGQYVSWANSWAEVYTTEGTKHSDQVPPPPTQSQHTSLGVVRELVQPDFEFRRGRAQGEGSYLDRPNGLLTRPDVALLSGALNMAVASANELEETFGPVMVYNRPALQELMRTSPSANMNEWIDEQAGSH